MYVKDLVDLVNSGKFPVVRFTKTIDDSFGCVDSVIEKGMVAKIIAVKQQSFDSQWFGLTFDLSIDRKHNIALLSSDWYLLSKDRLSFGRKCGTALESGWLHDNLTTENCFPQDTLIPCELVESDSLLSLYMDDKNKDPENKTTYIEWLEEQLRNSCKTTNNTPL